MVNSVGSCCWLTRSKCRRQLRSQAVSWCCFGCCVVQWKNEEERMWEPYKNLSNCHDAIQQFLLSRSPASSSGTDNDLPWKKCRSRSPGHVRTGLAGKTVWLETRPISAASSHRVHHVRSAVGLEGGRQRHESLVQEIPTQLHSSQDPSLGPLAALQR
jgi:hypothetical protein